MALLLVLGAAQAQTQTTRPKPAPRQPAPVQVQKPAAGLAAPLQAIDDRLNQLAKAYAGRCGVVALNANDAVTHPDDSFEAMRQRALARGYAFPYLWDEEQTVARALGAACTPDFFLYDSHRRLVYRGRLDNNWKDASRVTRQDLKEAIDGLLAGDEPQESQHPSMGCSIKWK